MQLICLYVADGLLFTGFVLSPIMDFVTAPDGHLSLVELFLNVKWTMDDD